MAGISEAHPSILIFDKIQVPVEGVQHPTSVKTTGQSDIIIHPSSPVII